MQSMLPGAPWLLAHKSMLAVNQPYPMPVRTWGQCYQRDGAKSKAMAAALWPVRFMP
jgi:hypothetical protein